MSKKQADKAPAPVVADAEPVVTIEESAAPAETPQVESPKPVEQVAPVDRAARKIAHLALRAERGHAGGVEPAPVPGVSVGDKVTYTPTVGDKVTEPVQAEVTHVHNHQTVNLKYPYKKSVRYVASVKQGSGPRSWR